MVKTNHFFEKHPAIFERCLEVNKAINNAFGQNRIAENEVSFDLILPFLFEDIATTEATQYSTELRLHREIVDCYNSGVKEVSEVNAVLKNVSSVKPVSFSAYQNINRQTRKFLNDDLKKSYLQSTERVYYRFQILDNLKLDLKRKDNIKQRVKEFSAFLLFDDDIYDLESDIATGKKTILTQYLVKGNHLDKGIADMIQLLKNGSDLFEQFTNHFKIIYANDRTN